MSPDSCLYGTGGADISKSRSWCPSRRVACRVNISHIDHLHACSRESSTYSIPGYAGAKMRGRYWRPKECPFRPCLARPLHIQKPSTPLHTPHLDRIPHTPYFLGLDDAYYSAPRAVQWSRSSYHMSAALFPRSRDICQGGSFSSVVSFTTVHSCIKSSSFSMFNSAPDCFYLKIALVG